MRTKTNYLFLFLPLPLLMFSLACGGSEGENRHFNSFFSNEDLISENTSGDSNGSGSGSGTNIVGTLPSSGEPNHEGRVLPDLPIITKPTLFNSEEADAVMAAVQMFPTNNAWNEDISSLSVISNSQAMVNQMGADENITITFEQAYVIIPDGQPLVEVELTDYPSQSDPGPYPMPDNAPVEEYPIRNSDLYDHQQNGTGDRHILIIDPYNKKLYEFWHSRRAANGDWSAANEATFDLTTNELRPDGWTSSDAAGLPIIPALPRYDEIMRGKVEHALRMTFRRTRRSYVYPATHHAGHTTSTNYCRMGERLRLKASVDTSNFSPESQAITYAMKKYGIIVADNGRDWYISFTSDPRVAALDLDDVESLKGSDFEFVQTTGPNDYGR